MEKDSKIDQRILGSNRLQKDQEIALKTKHIVPYLGAGTKTAASSSHSHAKAIACRDNCQARAGLELDDIRRLCRRLDILEKDTQLMKKLFFGNVEERHELLKEISQHLLAIEEHLRNSTAEGNQQKVTSIINIAKVRHDEILTERIELLCSFEAVGLPESILLQGWPENLAQTVQNLS